MELGNSGSVNGVYLTRGSVSQGQRQCHSWTDRIMISFCY